MNNRDPLQCSFDDARRITLQQGIALDTRAKIAFFEEMVSIAFKFDARDRLAGRRDPAKKVRAAPSPSR